MSIGDFANIQQWAAVRAAGFGVRRVRPDGRTLVSGHTLLVTAALITVSLVVVVPTYLIIRTVGAGEATLETLSSARTWQTLGNTLLLVVTVAGASAALAVPMAWLTTWTDLPGRRLWSVAAALPLVVPSYVAAYLYASLLSPKGIVQQALQPLLGH